MKILSLAPLRGPGLDRLRGLGEVVLDPWNDHVPVKLHSPDELIPRLLGVEVLLAEADHISAEVLDGAPALRIVGACRGDPVNVDLAAATEGSIVVLHAPARNAGAVAELTLGMIIALTRGIVAADDDARAGRWVVDLKIAQQRYRARELGSMTVGLIGCGAVGREAGRRLVALGATVVGSDPYAPADTLRAAGIEPVSLDELLARADVVSVHSVLNDETRGLLDAAAFAKMKPGASLVNTARYGIADERAMLDALTSGRLAGVALDHFENEFLPPDHPLVSMPNVILTPHIGGSTWETIEAHTTAMADGIEALRAGREPPNVANPEALPAFFASRG